MAPAPSEPHPPCADPSAVEARYLLTMFDLERSGATPTQAEVARGVGVSAPTALEMIRRLRGMGFVEPDAIALTHAGQSAALVLSSRRAAAHALVHDVLGIEDELSRARGRPPRHLRVPRARPAPAGRARAHAQAARLGEEALADVPAGAGRRAARANSPLPVCWMYSLSASLAPSRRWSATNWPARVALEGR